MHEPIDTRNRVIALILAGLTAVVLAACGSSSGATGPQRLLEQTFSGSHKVQSGVLSFDLTLNPSGSSTLKTPISVSLSGPFQSRGPGKLPQSNFNIAFTGLWHHGSLGLISTGDNGYITLRGQPYQLPASDFQRLASSFSGASGGATGGGLSKLGIDPLHWLIHPSVIGDETVAGAATTHIRAGVNTSALLADLNTFLRRASASSATASTGIPTTISPATRARIAAAIKNATVDVWTGRSDKTLRKLALSLNVAVTGLISSLFGGMSSAGVAMSFQYADLNQPQTIAAPTQVRPFAEFAVKLRGVAAQLQSMLGGAGLGSTGGAGSSGSAPTGSAGSSSGVNQYTKCIQQAAGDVTKLQKCAPLLSSGG